MKAKLLLGGYVAVFCSFALWRNAKRYQDRGWAFLTCKSLFDVSLSALLANFFSPLLISFSALWAIRLTQEKFSKDAVWSCITGVVSGTAAAWLSSHFMEAAMLVGIEAIDQLTGKIVRKNDWLKAAKVAA